MKKRRGGKGGEEGNRAVVSAYGHTGGSSQCLQERWDREAPTWSGQGRGQASKAITQEHALGVDKEGAKCAKWSIRGAAATCDWCVPGLGSAFGKGSQMRGGAARCFYPVLTFYIQRNVLYLDYTRLPRKEWRQRLVKHQPSIVFHVFLEQRPGALPRTRQATLPGAMVLYCTVLYRAPTALKKSNEKHSRGKCSRDCARAITRIPFFISE